VEEYAYHEAANIFPMMTEEELRGLKADIAANGLAHPVELFEGKIIDGRNRYLACLELAVKCEFVEKNIDDPVSYVLTNNLARRHLTASQKAIVAGKADELREVFEKRAKERQKASGGDRKSDHVHAEIGGGNFPTTDSHKSRDDIGKALGISGSMADRGKKVVKQGTEKLVKAVEQGKMSVTTAAKLTEADAAVQDAEADSASFSGGRYRKRNKRKATDNSENVPVKGYENSRDFALETARVAITQLERIKKSNPGRDEAFTKVENWIKKQRKHK
jgi:ParB-like chromosome segregation protein Spo0J